MKKFLQQGIITTAFFFLIHIAFCQKNNYSFQDPSLETNSEKWKVKQYRGLPGISKAEFGPFATIEAGKLDPAVIRKKTRDSSGTGVIISKEGWDWDLSKFETIEKKKFYRMQLTTDADTAEIMFSIYSISAQKKQTLPGGMLSKNNEEKNATLSYRKYIAGTIFPVADSPSFRFFLEDYVTTRQTTGNGEPGITRGYILTNDDSLFTEPVMGTVGKPAGGFFLEWQEGMYINNVKGNHIASLKFEDGQSPFYTRIRKDLALPDRQAIASFFALLIAVAGI